MNKALLSLQLDLLNAGHVMLDKSWNYDHVHSPFSRLYLIRKGEGFVHHHDRVFRLRPGRMYLIPSFTHSRYWCSHSMEQYYVHFLEEAGMGLSVYGFRDFLYERQAGPLEKSLFERLLAINPQRGLARDDPKVYDNKTSLSGFRELNNRLSDGEWAETVGILLILFSGFMDPSEEAKKTMSHKAGKITEILHYINQHLAEDIPIKQLAERCHLHPDYFSRLFKEQTGRRPVQYIQDQRIQRAQLLLTTTDHSLQDIADRVGLSNISYFSRLFTRSTKKTPAVFRKEHWNI